MIKLKYEIPARDKTAFYCSDFGKLDIDLYFAFTNTPRTNPPEWFDTLKWGAGKGVELALLDRLKENGIVNAEYNQDVDGRVDFKREGIEIHGYIDAMTTGDNLADFGLEAGCPIEIKSINNANKFDIAKYETENPRDNYVGQLAVYMDFLGKETGYLFVASIDGLHTFFFECKKVMDGVYKCGNTQVNVNDEYKRWANVLERVKDKQIPECPIRYKLPINEIDWTKLSTTDISKARNGSKVIGDPDSWKISYSDWKDLIVSLQGASVGYSEQELETIINLTKGYTSKK